MSWSTGAVGRLEEAAPPPQLGSLQKVLTYRMLTSYSSHVPQYRKCVLLTSIRPEPSAARSRRVWRGWPDVEALDRGKLAVETLLPVHEHYAASLASPTSVAGSGASRPISTRVLRTAIDTCLAREPRRVLVARTVQPQPMCLPQRFSPLAAGRHPPFPLRDMGAISGAPGRAEGELTGRHGGRCSRVVNSGGGNARSPTNADEHSAPGREPGWAGSDLV